MKIDAHQHFWKISRGDYGWMDDTVAPIRRDIGPSDLQPTLSRLGIDGTVVVQAADTVAETRYLLSLADETPWILGVVGWVDLASDTAISDLTTLAQHPRLKGVRPMLQDIADADWILQDRVLAKLAHVADLGLRLDALVTPRHLKNIDTLAQTLPDLPIVIDHCAKPEILGGQDAGETWHEDMTTLSRHPQIMCKLSGLANEFGLGWSADGLRPVFDHVISIFGTQRLMWGSDWPVLDLAGDYACWHATARSLAADLSPREQSDLFGGTAARFYGIPT